LPGHLKKVINNCVAKLQKDAKGQNGLLPIHPSKAVLTDSQCLAVAFHFSRIGNDEGAKKLIEDLDNDETLGKWIDCFPGL
jgi:hypothetical protein